MQRQRSDILQLFPDLITVKRCRINSPCLNTGILNQCEQGIITFYRTAPEKILSPVPFRFKKKS